MFKKKECIAMLLAGGQGSRLYTLTDKTAKPAVPFGGKYRIIDFPMSNCVNSGIDTVGVLTQYQPLVLNEYIGNGEYVCRKEINFSYGTTEALFLGIATAPTDFAYHPRVGVKSEDDEEYTITTVNLTDVGAKGTMVPLPTGELDCYVDIRNPIADYIKPFRTYFHIGRANQ